MISCLHFLPFLSSTSPIRWTTSRLRWKLLPVRRHRLVPAADIDTVAPEVGTNGQDFSTQKRKLFVGLRRMLSLADIPIAGVRMPLVMSSVSASATARAAFALNTITLSPTPKVIRFPSLPPLVDEWFLIPIREMLLLLLRFRCGCM